MKWNEVSFDGLNSIVEMQWKQKDGELGDRAI